MSLADLPIMFFASTEEFDAWLAAEASTSSGIWLKLAKKGTGVSSVSRQEAIECALCHGWIDGQLKPFDADYWLVRFTPRKAKSKWSQKNCEIANRLIEQKRMQPAGRVQVDHARADGRWEAAYPRQSTAAVPDDLGQALDANPAARAMFERLDGTNRFAILYRVHNAKRSETRANRIDNFVAMLARGETIYPLKRKG